MPSLAMKDNPSVLYVPWRGGVYCREFPRPKFRKVKGKWKIKSKRPWRLAIVKPNADRTFARKCIDGKICYFLPMKPRTVMIGGKKKKGMEILFPGYVFFRADDTEFYIVKRFRKHKALVTIPDQMGIDRELYKLYQALEWCLGKMEKQFPLLGRVAIVAGPLSGLSGQVVAHEPDKATVRIAIDMAMGTAQFRVPADNLGPIIGPISR
jgi:transcription antitermination factor NusG